MKKLLLVSIFSSLLFAGIIKAQNWAWAHSAGGPQKVESYSIAVDDMGNSYITGWFEDSLYIGDTVVVASVSGNLYASDIFIAKYSREGDFKWVRKVGGTDYDYGNGIAVDNLGNVLVTGLFTGTVNFGTHSITSVTQDYDIFIAKYDANGNELWVKSGGGTGWDVGNGVSVDPNNNCYITGAYRNTATFGTSTITSQGNYDVYIAKYDANGSLQWVQSSGGTGDDRGQAIYADANGNSFVSGFFNGSAPFGTTTLTSYGGSDVFFAKYDPAGNALWAKKAGGISDDVGNAIKVMPSSDIYVTGYFTGTANFDTIAIASYGNADAFVAKYDYKGDIIWLKGYGGSQNDEGYGICADTFSNIYVAGSFWGSGQFDTINTASYNQDDAFVVGIDTQDKTKWVLHAGGINADASRAIAAAPYGRCYTTGYFSGFADFGSEFHLTGYSDNDLFIARLDSTFIYDSVPLIDSVPNNNTGISSLKINQDIMVYPNPFSSSTRVNIETMAAIKHIELIDMVGREVSGQTTITERVSSPKQRELVIEGSNLNDGIYILKIATESELFTKRLLLSK